MLDTPDNEAALQKSPEFRALYLVVNLEAPGEVISVLVWKSAERGRAFYGSETYKCIFGGAAHLVSEPPIYKQLEVKIENVLEARLA